MGKYICWKNSSKLNHERATETDSQTTRIDTIGRTMYEPMEHDFKPSLYEPLNSGNNNYEVINSELDQGGRQDHHDTDKTRVALSNSAEAKGIAGWKNYFELRTNNQFNEPRATETNSQSRINMVDRTMYEPMEQDFKSSLYEPLNSGNNYEVINSKLGQGGRRDRHDTDQTRFALSNYMEAKDIDGEDAGKKLPKLDKNKVFKTPAFCNARKDEGEERASKNRRTTPPQNQQ